MRKTLIALLLSTTFPAMAMTEHGQGAHEGREGGHRHGHMLRSLDLNPEQRQQMGPLMREQMKNRHSITQRYLEKLPAAEQQAMEAELQAAQKANESAIRALLNPEQQKAFDAQQAKHQERRAERAEFQAWKAQQASKTE
ncbi:MAG: Spy/CpxP family protein refolding chaperone [Pseudomonadota bacterium]